MPVTYKKAYRPIHTLVDAHLLGQSDEYKGSTPRSQHIHAALELYVEHLRKKGT